LEAKVREELAGYYAHIEATDRAIGALVANVSSETWVVVTSVHGDLHGAHGLRRKGWPHEEAVRVPLLVRAPREKHTKAHGSEIGASSSEVVSLVELPRWTLAWAEGSKTAIGAAERGTRNAESGTEFQRISMPSVVGLPHQCDRVWRGVRTRERKLVLNADGSPWLLFDLKNDPDEMRNLSADVAWRDEVERLKALMEPPNDRSGDWALR
jgi:arylsulfatase A-like enzyme